MEIKWVGQEDAWGCSQAAVAMVVGKTYQEVKAFWDNDDSDYFKKHGKSFYDFDQQLAAYGYATARIYSNFKGKPRSDWPPAPFGEIHLCTVMVSESSPGGHIVVMLKDGTVLDPLSPEPKSLTDYWRVDNVAVVVPFKRSA
jgi:hypothetical protein